MTSSLSRSTPASASLKNPNTSIALTRDHAHIQDTQDRSKCLFELVPIRRASTGELSDRLPAPRKITLVEVHHAQTVTINPAPEAPSSDGKRNKAVDFSNETTTILYPKSPRSDFGSTQANKTMGTIIPRGKTKSTAPQPIGKRTPPYAIVPLNPSLQSQIRRDRVTIESRLPDQPQNAPAKAQRLQRTSHLTSGLGQINSIELMANTIHKLITGSKEVFAASPQKRILNILYCSTGKKSQLDKNTYPEVVSFADHLQDLVSLAHRFDHLDGLYDKLKIDLSPSQQENLSAALEKGKQANKIESFQKALKAELKKIN